MVPPGRSFFVFPHGSKVSVAFGSRELFNSGATFPELESAICLGLLEVTHEVVRQHPDEDSTNVVPVPADDVHNTGGDSHVHEHQG